MRAQSGKLVASPFPLYGYLWADEHGHRGKSRYIIDSETAPVIQRIYREAAAGVKLLTLGRTLTTDGIPTPAQILIRRGFVSPTRFQKMSGDWTRTMLRRILSNAAYMGQYVAYRTITNTAQERTPEGQMRLQSRTTLRNEEDPSRVVLSEETCPAIIGRELFEKVQEQLKLNKEEASRNNTYLDSYLLRSGLAVCGYCGSNMIANTSGLVGKKVKTYRCGRASRSFVNRCTGGSFVITSSVLDTAIWGALTYLFSEPQRIRAVLETQQTVRSDEDKREVDHLKATEGELREVIRKLENATRSVLTAADDDTHALWDRQVTILVAQRKALEKALDELNQGGQRRKEAYQYIQTIEDWCQALGPEIMEASYEEKRYLLRGLKTKVTCYRADHDPRYLVEWDLAHLHEPLRKLLPNLTEKDVARLSELNNTYFRHQSPDYQPGAGFVEVRV
ncbi:MAG: recombinase family protein [Ktedonobacteraceae bacterium]|nr:recombinase family protein [Ktedonobacteraceae bacterium]